MRNLARPTKWRKVEFIPNIQYFAPSDIDTASLQENILRIEELEAIRLKDLEGMEQEECADKMEVSRQTFQRILNAAREKIADSFSGLTADDIYLKSFKIGNLSFIIQIIIFQTMEKFIVYWILI